MKNEPHNKLQLIRQVELGAKHMLPVIITSNKISGNIYTKVEAVSVILVDVQEHQKVQTLLETSQHQE